MTTFVLGEPEFGRYTLPDREAVAGVLEATIDLGTALTVARREREAVDLLRPAVDAARREGAAPDALGWAVLTLATAEQYAGRPDRATAGFTEALALARSAGDEELEHYTLHHLAGTSSTPVTSTLPARRSPPPSPSADASASRSSAATQ